MIAANASQAKPYHVLEWHINGCGSCTINFIKHPLQSIVDLLVQSVYSADLLHDLFLVHPEIRNLFLFGLDLPRFEVFVLFGVGEVGVLLERVGSVLLSVVSPVFVASGLWLALVVSGVGVVVLVAFFVSEVHLLGLLEGFLDVLVLDALSRWRSLGAPLDHRLGIDPSPRFMPLQNAVIRGVLSWDAAPVSLLVHGVVHRCSFVGRRGGGVGVILQPSVGVIFVAEALHFLRALRVDIVLKAAFVGLVHSNVRIILSINRLKIAKDA